MVEDACQQPCWDISLATGLAGVGLALNSRDLDKTNYRTYVLLGDGSVKFVKDTVNIQTWRAMGSRNMGEITNQPYVYLLPGESDGDFAGNYERLAEKAHLDVARGIISGNMLAYASPASAKMADIVIASFKDVPPETMTGVRVVFIGDAADNERVKAAVSPAGVTYVFVEAK